MSALSLPGAAFVVVLLLHGPDAGLLNLFSSPFASVGHSGLHAPSRSDVGKSDHPHTNATPAGGLAGWLLLTTVAHYAALRGRLFSEWVMGAPSLPLASPPAAPDAPFPSPTPSLLSPSPSSALRPTTPARSSPPPRSSSHARFPFYPRWENCGPRSLLLLRPLRPHRRAGDAPAHERCIVRYRPLSPSRPRRTYPHCIAPHCCTGMTAGAVARGPPPALSYLR